MRSSTRLGPKPERGLRHGPPDPVKVRYSKAADRDLRTIYLVSDEQFGSKRADAYVAMLRGATGIIAEYPLSSRLRPETDPPVRARPCGSHVIIYVVDEAGVLILRIRHGHEDWQTDPVGNDLEGNQS